ncbi:MAG: prepilin-type N-terminal cleavage/methylation domain-containing protein [Candidatus Paceibacterota bacterium]
MKSKRLIAFTLIELLVVIAIVGILSGFVLISLNSATDSAKDVKTKNDLAAISRAILTYHALNNAYPIEETPCSIGDGTCLNELVPNHIQSFPLDFNNNRYQYSSDGTSYTLT